MVAPLFQDRLPTGDTAPSGFELAFHNTPEIAVTLRLTDHDVDSSPGATDLQRFTTPLSELLSADLDGASTYLGVPAGKILLAALGRTVARTMGTGVLAVDVDSHVIALECVPPAAADATQMLADVCAALTGSTIRQPGQALTELAFRAGPVSSEQPLAGHALELRAYLDAGLVQLDWWYDARRFDPYTVEELTEQFPQALIEITSEAVPAAQDVA